ncbi:unnamed protein product, partial [Rotaria sordida]
DSGRGLQMIDPPAGTFVQFACAANATASDGASTTTDIGTDKKKEETYSSKYQKDTVAAAATTSTVNTGINSITKKVRR